MEKRRILIVDDHQANVELIRLQLSPLGYELNFAFDGLEALEKVRAWRPDLVLLDLMMPKLDGYDVCQTIKQDPELRLIPVIVVTALRELDDKLKAIDMGADDFLVKPFNKLELTTRIRSLLRMKELNDDLERSENILFSLAQALESKDPYTRGHSDRVATYARDLAKRVGLGRREQEDVWRGGLLHDIGKIGVKEDILHKPGRLTVEEFEHVKSHPQRGYEICCRLKSLQSVLTVIHHHHERCDGKGYPEGLKGDGIPLLGRIGAIADTFDAMTTDRPYRKGMTRPEALTLMEAEQESGQWDRRLLAEFIRMIREQLVAGS